MKPSEKHRQAQSRILSFRDAYVELANITTFPSFGNNRELMMLGR
jgi:hypothetical protein